jgi:hypothetical protein
MNIVLIAARSSCESESVELGYFRDASEEENLITCAQAVIDAGYQFFIQDPNDGQCLVEMTEVGSCPEGLSESSYYNYYAAYGWGGLIFEEPNQEQDQTQEMELNVILISEGTTCNSETVALGYFLFAS